MNNLLSFFGGDVKLIFNEFMEATKYNSEIILMSALEDVDLLSDNHKDPFLEKLPDSVDFDFEIENYSNEKLGNLFKCNALTQEEVKESFKKFMEVNLQELVIDSFLDFSEVTILGPIVSLVGCCGAL
jgi:hypothetical protein